jgi:hypothetical protein
MTSVLIQGRAYELMVVLEETLEFGGTSLLALSAVTAWSQQDVCAGAIRRRLRVSVFVSAVAVVVLGGLFTATVFRVPVVDARGTGGHAVNWVSLEDGQSVAQEFPMPGAPLAGLSVTLVNRDPEGRPGVAVWRVLDSPTGSSGDVVWQGRVEAPAGIVPAWVDIDVPLLTATEGQRLLLQVAAVNEQGAALRVGMVQGDRFKDGRLWVNGELTWPDQDLELVVHGAREPTRSKLGSLWRLFTSDWRWVALAAKAFVALTFVTLIPVLLISLTWPRPRAGGIPSGLR